MKTIVILIGLLVAYVTAQGEECPLTVATRRSTGECVESMNPSAETLQMVSEARNDGSEDVQCFYACILEKAGLTNGASVDVEKMESLMQLRVSEIEKRIRIVVDLLQVCKAEAEVSDNECEVLGNFHTCWTTKFDASFSP